jgi:hypothetical protein
VNILNSTVPRLDIAVDRVLKWERWCMRHQRSSGFVAEPGADAMNRVERPYLAKEEISLDLRIDTTGQSSRGVVCENGLFWVLVAC